MLGCNDTDTSACQDETIPFIYTPEPNYFGQDNFTYRVEDRNASRPNSDLDGTVSPVRWPFGSFSSRPLSICFPQGMSSIDRSPVRYFLLM